MEEIIVENDYHREFLDGKISGLFNSGFYSDIEFLIEGESIKCHKVILAAASSYFHQMFNTDLTGSDVIEITTISYDSFQAILSFIYTGKIRFTEQNAQNLLHCSDLMDLKELKDVMVGYFINQMDPSNSLGFYHMASLLSADKLETQAFEFSLDKFSEVVMHDDFLEMPLQTIKHYLGHPALNAVSEDKVCSAATAWALHQPYDRLEYFNDLLSVVRLENLSPDFIHYSLLTNEDLNNNIELMSMLQTAFKHILFNLGLPKSIKANFPRTRTNTVPGVAILWQDRNPSNKTGVETNIGFFAFQSTNEFVARKMITTDKDFTYLDSDSSKTVFVIEDCVYCPAGSQPRNTEFLSGLYKYDITLNKLSFRSLPSLLNSDNHIIISAEKDFHGHKFHAIEVANSTNMSSGLLQISSVVPYIYDKDLWFKQAEEEDTVMDYNYAILKGCFVSCTYRDRVYLFGVSVARNPGQSTHNTNKVHFNQIVSFETNSNKTNIHKTKLPCGLTNMKCCMFRNYIIISGVENMFILDLAEIHEECTYEAELAEYFDQVLSENSVEVQVKPSNNSSTVIRASNLGGIKGSKYQIHMVGNQLILLFANSTSSERDILCVDIEDCLANNTNITWKKIGVIPEDIALENLCLTASVNFEQNIN